MSATVAPPLEDLVTPDPQAVRRRTAISISPAIQAPAFSPARHALLELAAATPLLGGLGEAQLERIIDGASVERFGKGALIFCEGEEARTLHLMLGGLVELFTGEQSKDRAVMIMCRGDIFIPGAALGGEPYLLSARAVRPSRTLSISAKSLRSEMLKCPKLATRMAMISAGQFRTAVRHLKDLKTRSGPQRLAAFLLNLIDESPVAGSAELPFAKRTLASRMGMSPESLSRSIQILSDHGIRVRGGRAILDDRAAIERFCRPDPLIDGRERRLKVNAY
jgi:CRP/FNR family transcriptional activator FtrB